MSVLWVDAYLWLIFQIYGLTFIVLGVSATLSMRRDRGGGLSAHLGWLAVFGILHGLHKLIEAERLHNPSALLLGGGNTLIVISFIALLEFGRRLWNERPGSRRLPALPLYAAVLVGLAAFMETASTSEAGLELGARYLIGAPGALLAGLGLLSHARNTARAPDNVVIIRCLRTAAIALMAFASLSLFVTRSDGHALAAWLPSKSDFLAATSFPVQLLRALCAVVLAVAFVILNQRSRRLAVESLRRVTDRLDGFVYRCRNDEHWTVIYMSEGGESLTGYPAARFLRGGLHLSEMIHPADQQRVWDEVQAALAERRDFRLQYRMRAHDGIVRWCYEEGRGVFDVWGELMYLEGLVRNDDARHRAEAARRSMQALVEASPQPMGWSDPDGSMRYMNAALRTLLGLHEAVDINDFRLQDFYGEKACAQIEASVLPAVRAHGSWIGEVTLETVGGRRVPTLHSVFALRDEAGDISAIAAVITDLSPIRSAERELRIKDAAIAASSSAIALAGLDGALTYVNDAFVKLWGLHGPEQAIGRSSLAFWEDAGQAKHVADVLLRDGHWAGELRGIRADGLRVDVQLSANLVRGRDGEPLCMMGSFLDVSERNQVQQALRQERDYARNLIDTMPAIVLLLDTTGTIQDVNPWFEQLTGYRRDEVRGKEWFSTFLPERDRTRIRQVFFNALGDAPVRGYVNPILTREHVERSIEWHAMPLRDGGGSVTSMLSIGVDVTARQQLETQLREMNQLLELRVATRTAELERASTAKSEFLSRMSHELRTPLNAILGFAQILALPGRLPLSEQQDDNVQEILKAGQHLLGLVNEVLDLARIESGRIDICVEPLALAPMVSDCLSQLHPLAVARGILMDTAIKGRTGILGDAVRVRQVLINLLSNAIKYNVDAGRIHVATRPDGDRLRIEVHDTGPGLSPEQRSRLFRPFERLETAYQGIEGTGIGLALVKRLVEAMDGEVGVESVEGKGSCFWFALPLAQLADESAPHVADSAITPPKGHGDMSLESAHPSKPHRVLYIEDNPANLKLVQRILGKHLQLSLLDAMNAEIGLEIARRERPDLILLDLNLPGMDGFAALSALQADSATRDIPVIAITANAMSRDVERGRSAGFADYLTKPLDVPGLLTAIQRCLHRAPSAMDCFP